jgi:hypothetical protein
VASLLNIAIGASTGASAAMPSGQPRAGADQLIAEIEARREPMEIVFKVLVTGMTAANTKALSLKELKRYRDAMAHPTAIEMRDVCMAAFDQEMRAQSMAIGAHFGRDISGRSL